MQASAETHERLNFTYDKLRAVGTFDGYSYAEWTAEIILILALGRGALVARKDTAQDGHTVAWLDVGTDHGYLSPARFRAFLALLATMDCHFAAAKTNNPIVSSYLLKNGFQEIDPLYYSLDIRGLKAKNAAQ